MPQDPVYPGVEPEPENIPEFQEVKPQRRKLGTGEPIFLYVEVSRGVYDNVGEFLSRVEASHSAEENWKGHRYKTLTADEAVAEQQRLQARQERVQKTVEKVEKGARKLGSGLKRVAKNLGRNAESEARYHGMIHDRPPAPPAQSVNVNVNTGGQSQPHVRDRDVENLQRMSQHLNRSFNPMAEDFNPPEAPPQKQYMIQKPSSKFSFAPPESPIKPLKHKLNPPESMIKPSKHTLDPPRPSTKQYGVRQRHGNFMFSDSIRPYKMPVHSLFPKREPAPVKQSKKQKKRRKR